MGAFIRKTTHTTYTHALKPLLFRSPPDAVHTRMVKIGKRLGTHRAVRTLTAGMWSFKDEILSQTIHGIHYSNPIGLAAGFDKNIELTPMMQAIGFGHTTGGSVTGKFCTGNPRPWFHRLPEYKSIAVHAGLGNLGSATIARNLHDAPTSRTLPLCISVARTNTQQTSTEEEGIKDYLLALRNMRPYADSFEINISCPNTYGGEPFTSPEKLHKLLSRIDSLQLTQPVYIKMPSDMSWKAFDALLKVITNHVVRGVTIANLRKNRTGLAIPETIKGGLSGKLVQAMSDALIEKTYQKYGDRLTIIGLGGIFSAEDAYQKIKKGASLVELATGLIYEGPSVVGEINAGLVELLKRDGYTHIAQAIGADVTVSTRQPK